MPVRFSKLIPSFTAFVFLAGLASRAEPAPPDATAAYLATRDQYIAEFNAHPPTDDPSDKREVQALASLEQRLQTIIPPWQAPRLSATGRISLSVLHQDLGFGDLDGLRYQTTGTEVIVTTPELLHRWIADHADQGYRGDWHMPQAADAAIRSEPFLTYSGVGLPDEGWFFFDNVPVKSPGGTATARIVTETDSGFPDAPPRYLLVAVLRDDRVFVARQDLAIKVPDQPVCETQSMKEREDKIISYEQMEGDFRTCYSLHLHEKPQYDAIQKQAQALVDLLR